MSLVTPTQVVLDLVTSDRTEAIRTLAETFVPDGRVSDLEGFLADIQRRMNGAIASLKHEFGGLRTGRASASLLEPVQVDAYGQHIPLTQVATISVPEPRLLSVQVWDRGMVQAVEKAIRESNLGLNPQTGLVGKYGGDRLQAFRFSGGTRF